MLEYVLFVVGIYFLVKGADLLVDGSSSLAKRLKISTLIIGLTIVSFGTSMPELIISVIAGLGGRGGIVFGNVIGSNISNILLVLGVTAIISHVKVQHSTVRKEIPFSLLAVFVLLVFANKMVFDKLDINTLLRFEGIILLLFFSIFLYYVFELAKKSRQKLEDDGIEIKKLSNKEISLYIFGGLLGLYFGGQWTVEGAVALARLFGFSEYLISLTIISIGTSLPELITSVNAARKKNVDLAVGNVVGSNIFNIFWVLGVSSLIAPVVIPAFAVIDLLILMLVTLLLLLFVFVGKKHEIERWQGLMFVLSYAAYLIYLFLRGG